MRASKDGMHISGAEGLFEASDISRQVNLYTKRALNHPKGKPDNITITVEEIKDNAQNITSLPVFTLKCGLQDEAKAHIRRLLLANGVSINSIQHGLDILYGGLSNRGAVLMRLSSAEIALSGVIRVSRLGISKDAQRGLSLKLKKHGINTETVKEALILASKVSNAPGIRAELCISDDPDYTTGYVSSGSIGYIRIPSIKEAGSSAGGRIFFIEEDADVTALAEYLRSKPVMITKTGKIGGVIDIDELIHRSLDS